MLWTVALRASRKTPLVRLPPSARIYPFGVPADATASDALLRFPAGGWEVSDGGDEGWAIVGDAEGRRLVVETLIGRHKITPNSTSPGPLPVATRRAPAETVDPDRWRAVRHLAFARPSTTGEFTDYTARYGALLDEDRETLRERLEGFFSGGLNAVELEPGQKEQAAANVQTALETMGMTALADMPTVALSSGQTRRARIAHALMTQPHVLLLEDPMAGLDVDSRARVDGLLGKLNAEQDAARIILVLRDKGDETLSSWVTHVCEVSEGDVWIGPREDWEKRRSLRKSGGEVHAAVPEGTNAAAANAEPVVVLNNVNVAYGEGARRVLKDVSWTIRPGDRWHLQGANGSGKTTLLSVLLGHHPQSFSMPASALTLFSQPRRLVPTPVLRQRIGHSSPEIYAAFPRNMGLSAYAAVGTGFEGVFSRRDLDPEQKARVLSLIEYFHLHLATSRTGKLTDMSVLDVARRSFAHFTPPQQALLVFLRAVVARPPVLVLDEPTQGMDEKIWESAREFLAHEWDEMRAEGKEQAVVVVSHYEDEVPWKHGRVLRLVDGVATEE